jgi:hypothetical protein
MPKQYVALAISTLNESEIEAAAIVRDQKRIEASIPCLHRTVLMRLLALRRTSSGRSDERNEKNHRYEF